MFEWLFGTTKRKQPQPERVPFGSETGAPEYDAAKHFSKQLPTHQRPFPTYGLADQGKQISVDLRSAQTFNCPFCRSADFSSLASLACVKCNAFMHLACWTENKNRCGASLCKAENPHLKNKPAELQTAETLATIAELKQAFHQLQAAVVDERKAQMLIAKAKKFLAEDRSITYPTLFQQAWDLYLQHHAKGQKDFALAIAEFPLSYALFNFRKHHSASPPQKEEFFRSLSKVPLEKLEKAERMMLLLAQHKYLDQANRKILSQLGG